MSERNMKKLKLIAVFLLMAAFSMRAKAVTTYDLTSVGSSETINGALFKQWDGAPMGTGNLDPFVRINLVGPLGSEDVEGEERGYNTDGNIEFDTKDDGGHNWTHSLLLSSLLPITEGGTTYYLFTLDINQAGGTKSYLSLDKLEIYLEATPDIGNPDPLNIPANDPDGYPFDFTNLVYALDAVEDSSITLDYSLNGGSGGGDLHAYIPSSLFSGGPYVYLYSHFGEYFPENDGFEEWAALKGVIPAPGAILLGSIGAVLVGWLRRRRML